MLKCFTSNDVQAPQIHEKLNRKTHMSDGHPFRVTFSGVITGEYDLETTKNKFRDQFELPVDQVDKYFSGEEYVLKDKVIEEVAMNFAIRIAESGCECYVEEITDDVESTTDSDKIEHRRGDRRITFRRPSRPGSIGADRRSLMSRRTDDKPKPTDD
jgi:hypothetical protein